MFVAPLSKTAAFQDSVTSAFILGNWKQTGIVQLPVYMVYHTVLDNSGRCDICFCICCILMVFISVTFSLILLCVTILLILFCVFVNADTIDWLFFCNCSCSNYSSYSMCQIHNCMLVDYLVFWKGCLPALSVIILVVPYDLLLLLGKCPLIWLFLHILWEYTWAHHWKCSLIGLLVIMECLF